MVDSYSPANLETAKELIVKTAIRRVLWDLDWGGSYEYGFGAHAWRGRLPAVSRAETGKITITWTRNGSGVAPPGAVELGEDEHRDVNYEVDPWNDIYKPWYDAVDEAFTGWNDLPDPAHFDTPIEAMRTAVENLVPLSSQGDEDYTSVALNAALNNLQANANPTVHSGQLVTEFHNNYGGDRVRDVMGNQAQIALVLGVALAGDQKIWEKARVDIMTLCDEAVKAFNGGSGSGSIDLGVVKAFAGLLGHFVPAPLKTVLAVGSSAIDLVQEFLPEESGDASVTLSITGNTAAAVFTSMTEAITSLNCEIADQEYDLALNRLHGVRGVLADRDAGDFHIHPRDGVEPELTSAPAIDVGIYALKEAGYEIVPLIASHILTSADKGEAADKRWIWSRPSTIGWGEVGPYLFWQALRTEYDNVTTGTAAELIEAGRLLAVGAGYLHDTDSTNRAVLNGLRDDLARGEDGWNNEWVDTPIVVGE